MKRVWMLTCQYMPDVFGGAEQQCQRVSRELADRGHRITVLTSTQQRARRGMRREDGVDVVRFWTPVAPDLLGRWMLFSAWWFCAVLLWCWRHRGDVDVIHCHQAKFGAFVAVCIGRLVRRPVLVKIGNSEDDMDLLCLQRKAVVGAPMARYVVRRRPQFVAISDVIRRNLADYGCRDIVKIPNGIPAALGVDPPAGDTAAGTRAGVQLFYHGRIEPIKRVDVLLEAYVAVAAARPDVHLHIVGSGAALDGARAAAQRLRIDARVSFHGRVDDVFDCIRGYDVFVNASRVEGFSNSLLEALLLGKMLVSTPVSGAAEAIVDGQNGYVATRFGAAELAQAMLAAIDSVSAGGLEHARAVSRRLVAETFSIQRVVDHYERLYPTLACR